MKTIQAKYEILDPAEFTEAAVKNLYKRIELAGRTCYKSEGKITNDSANKFVAALVKRGHEAMLEHAGMTVRFTVDRGVSHELVWHRLASFAQVSTRYCNYASDKFGSELTFIKPRYFLDGTLGYRLWLESMRKAEETYLDMIRFGIPPEWARSVLPHSLATEVVVTANFREWRTIFKLRAAGTTGKPHPQMREVMVPLLKELRRIMPEMFGDIMTEVQE